MAQQSTTDVSCVKELYEHAETDVPDDDTSSQCSARSRSSSEESCGSTRKRFPRRFVWADADSSDDEIDFTHPVVASFFASNQQSVCEEKKSFPCVPPGCHQPPCVSPGGNRPFSPLSMPCFTSAPEDHTDAFAPSAQQLQDALIEPDSRTTLIIKNLPAGCMQDGLCKILDEFGISGYDFIYVPINLRDFVAFRYCFVNFERNEDAAKAMATLDGFSGWAEEGDKACEVAWSGTQEGLYRSTGWSGTKQGLETLIERYRNSPLMHNSVPEVFRPALFKNGVRIEFPAPTKNVKAPKLRPVL